MLVNELKKLYEVKEWYRIGNGAYGNVNMKMVHFNTQGSFFLTMKWQSMKS